MIPFTETAIAPLTDREYFDFMLHSIETAKQQIWASLFIYDLRPSRDIRGKVLQLSTSLINKKLQGLDVRVLLAGYLRTADIAAANLASGLYLKEFGVPHRRSIKDNEQMGSHAKYVICDEVAVVGSQNWTDDGFRLNIEDALLLKGDAVFILESEFLRQWELGKGLPKP